MDVSGINWAYFALGVLGALFVIWVVRAWRRRPGLLPIVVSLALLLTAGINAAAPWRGLLDPDYVGYSFGYLRAERGWPVTAMAGSVFALAVAGAFLALERGRAAMRVTALICLAFTLNIGGRWLTSTLTEPSANRIQFGEYLTIPGEVGTVLLFVLFVLPFAAGAVWAGRRSLRA